MISLKNVSCSFDKREILDDISLEIEGDLSILGANGAGKSTLAKIICNLVAFEGSVTLEGKALQHYTPKEFAKSLCYIPPKLEIYDGFMTLQAFVLLGRFAYKKGFFDYSQEDKRLAAEALLFLGIADLADATVSSLSSGEMQLALIAQALTQQSKIIIFDEPTANLDPKNSKIIARFIKKLQASTQIILITHDIVLAAFIAAPVAFIKERKLHYFSEGFFERERLESLYEVGFEGYGVAYD